MLTALLLTVLSPSWAGSLPDIDSSFATGMRSPEDAAVIVGIEDYLLIPDVPYAERDATSFRDYLVDSRGIASDRVTLLTRLANREQILQAVERAAVQVGPSGTLWFFFAGHGSASPTTGERLLLGADVQADAATFEARGVPLSSIESKAGAGGGRVVLVLDTCYSGVGRDGAELTGQRFLVPQSAVSPLPRVIEWTAAGPNEVSGPLKSVEHGAFTYFAIGALRGWADGALGDGPDGRVTAEEAQRYVEDSMGWVVQQEQHPAMNGTSLGDWVLTEGHLEGAPEAGVFTGNARARKVSGGLLVGSAVMAAASGALWGAALVWQGSYEDEARGIALGSIGASPEELDGMRNRANQAGYAAQASTVLTLGLASVGLVLHW